MTGKSEDEPSFPLFFRPYRLAENVFECETSRLILVSGFEEFATDFEESDAKKVL